MIAPFLLRQPPRPRAAGERVRGQHPSNIPLTLALSPNGGEGMEPA